MARAARAEPVHGGPVLRRGEEGDTLVWATGPIPGSGNNDGPALVVFLDLDGSDDDPACATGPSSRPGCRPRSATRARRTTRWSSSTPPSSARRATRGTRHWGANCLYLQRRDTDPADVLAVRVAMTAEKHRSVTLRRNCKDGTAFYDEVSLSPVYNAVRELSHFLGIQADATSRVLVEQERERHLAADRAARTDAERAQRRPALLAEVTSMLAATLDVDESLDRLISLVVPLMADWCTVHLPAPDGGVQRVAARRRDAEKLDLLRRLDEVQATGIGPGSMTTRVLDGGAGTLLAVDADALAAGVEDQELLELYRQVGLSSAIVVPLRARRHVLGVLSLFIDGSGRIFDADDLATAAVLARARRRRAAAAQLAPAAQAGAGPGPRRALPARCDRCAGRRRLVRPVRAARRQRGIAVGDVMGHDMPAAAAMGQLRSVLQSYAWQGSSPAVVLDRLDQLVPILDMAQLATCLYGRLDPPVAGAAWRLRFANAGHLPPALRSPDGEMRLLGTEASLLVGAVIGTTRHGVEEMLEAGSLLVPYTDGLVEHRGRSLNEGLVPLAEALRTAPDSDADAVCEHLLTELAHGDLDDHVALLVMRVLA